MIVHGSAGHVTAKLGYRTEQYMGTGLDCHDGSTVPLAVSQQNMGTEHIRTWAQNTAEQGHRPRLSRLSTVVVAVSQQNMGTGLDCHDWSRQCWPCYSKTWAQKIVEHWQRPGLSRLPTVLLAVSQQNRKSHDSELRCMESRDGSLLAARDVLHYMWEEGCEK